MDDRQGIANKHRTVKNPTWCGREVQWCRVSDLLVGDRLITPVGETRVTGLMSRRNSNRNSTIITCALPVRGDFTFELKPSQWAMRLERGEPRKTPSVRNIPAGDVRTGDYIYVGDNRCYKAMTAVSVSDGIAVVVLDPEVRVVDGHMLVGAYPLDTEEQSPLTALASGLLLFTGLASSLVSIVDEGVTA